MENPAVAPRAPVGRALRVAVIIGSTRQGRIGDGIGRWFVDLAVRSEPHRVAQAESAEPDAADADGPDAALSVVDLAEFRFPDRYPRLSTPPMARFAAAVDRSEAFVIVTPEYNRSFPASLKQAIDYAYDEWQAKPVGFVSYGFGTAGVYAVEQLRSVFTELHVVTLRDTVSLDLCDTDLDGDGRPRGQDRHGQAVATLLDRLLWWGLALRAARARRPYTC